MENLGFGNWFSGNSSVYLYAPVVCLVWMVVAFFTKRILFGRLKAWSQKTVTQWDDILIRALSMPINLLILASAILILTRLLPLSTEVDSAMMLAFKAAIIFAIVSFVDRFAVSAIQQKETQAAFGQASYGIVKGLIRGLVLGLGALIFLQLAGVSITPILASLGVGSLAVALALQDTLSNFFAGIYITIDKPVRVGDYVMLDSGEEGYVTEIGWRSTHIKRLQNNLVIVPNSKLMGSIITNYYMPEKDMAVLVQVGVHYASDLSKVEKVTVDTAQEVLKKTQGAVADFEPFIRYHTFGDSSINFTVILRAHEYTDQYLLKHEFIKALHARYHKEGIVIPFPIRTFDISKETLSDIRSTLKS